MSLDVGLNALLAGLAVVTFVGRRPVQAVATVSYVAIVIVTIALVAPSAQ
jgi:hypothetical protein